MALTMPLTEKNLSHYDVLSELPPLSPDALSKGPPFSNCQLLDTYVPYPPRQSGPDRMYDLDSCMVRYLAVESRLPEYPIVRGSIRRLITAILAERQHTLEWMEHQRRQANRNTVVLESWTSADGSDEMVTSLTHFQRMRKRRANRRRPFSRPSPAEESSSNCQAMDEKAPVNATRLLTWLSEVPDGMPPDFFEANIPWSRELVMAAPAA